MKKPWQMLHESGTVQSVLYAAELVSMMISGSEAGYPFEKRAA